MVGFAIKMEYITIFLRDGDQGSDCVIDTYHVFVARVNPDGNYPALSAPAY
jgi:hypothetical protein